MTLVEEPEESPLPYRPLRGMRRSHEEDSAGDLSDNDLDMVANKRLCFDETEDDLIIPEEPEQEHRAFQDAPMADLSGLRHQLGSMDMEHEEIIERSMVLFSTPDIEPPASPLATVSEHDESGLHDMSVSPGSDAPPQTVSDIVRNPATPVHFLSTDKHPPAHRRTFGEVPKSPIKSERYRSRFSLEAGSEIECTSNETGYNVNPFATTCLRDENSVDSRTGNQPLKRSAATAMLSTPDLIMNDISPPESGYGSCKNRPKYMKTDRVRFSLGSPSSTCSGGPMTRYDNDFVELEVIGHGHFGRVTKARKRLDGVIYAVKRTEEKVNKRSFTDIVTEVFALAALDSHPNVLRYFSSWIENGHLYIQSEYCDAGSLRTHIDQSTVLGKRFDEDEIRRIARQAGNGLLFLHEQKLVHLDVKPGNIFMSYRRTSRSGCSPPDGKVCEDDQSRYLYKIGDLGHVRSFRDGSLENYNDGDKGYLSPEILHCLHEPLRDPPKADVYSLGVTLFETARIGRMMEAGMDWQRLDVAQRNGIIPGIAQLSLSLNVLLQRMTDLNPCFRLSMHDVLCDAALHPSVTSKSVSELQKDLEVAHMENMVLTRELKASRGSGPILGDCGQRRGVGAIKPKITLLGRTMKSRAFSTQF